MGRIFSLVIIAGLALSVLPHLPAQAAPKKARPNKKSKAAALALKDEPRTIAEAYLTALEGKGDVSAKGFLLGGVTFTAEDAIIPNWKIFDRKAPLKESTFLAPAIKKMHDLDIAGAQALTGLYATQTGKKAASPAQIEALLAPGRVETAAFQKDHPLFARVARVGKAIYWHPHNPWRLLVESIDHSGKYNLELHVFIIEESAGKAGKRTWPLRVVRFTTDHHDSGWKILPASSWDPDF